ncbi:TPA: hypothetical protein ACYLN4_006858, partial [Burkholderia lata]
ILLKKSNAPIKGLSGWKTGGCDSLIPRNAYQASGRKTGLRRIARQPSRRGPEVDSVARAKRRQAVTKPKKNP